ncbi:MAG: SIR2 family protein [Ardenticatenales bacterium]|nr:SIR2 family protein [Ardenticatenales bacterium]
MKDLLERRFVPFVGAGVSLECRDPHDASFEPTVGWLEKQVRETFHTGVLDTLSFTAETAARTDGYESVFASMRINSFARLMSAPFHRYLARLSHEGWIRDVVTTNWDTCIEAAWRADPGRARARSGMHVAHNTRTCRRDGAVRLTVHKINGCAERSAHDAVSILVTDKQLIGDRSSRSSVWKYELLKERLRAYAVVFVGFGGEEAQVRQIVEEVVRESSEAARTDEAGTDHFVLCFSPELSKYHKQILGADENARNRHLCGKDIEHLTGETGMVNLPADEIWRMLYVAALSHCIVKDIREVNTGIRDWLRDVGAGHTGKDVVLRTLSALPEPKRPASLRPSAEDALFPALWFEPVDDPPDNERTLPWQRALWIARMGTPPSRPRHVQAPYPWEVYVPHYEQAQAASALALLVAHPAYDPKPDVLREGRMPLHASGDGDDTAPPDRQAILLWEEGTEHRERTIVAAPEAPGLPTHAIAFPRRKGSRPLRVRLIRGATIRVFEVPCLDLAVALGIQEVVGEDAPPLGIAERMCRRGLMLRPIQPAAVG